jgi:long-chain fatty acid transport protein
MKMKKLMVLSVMFLLIGQVFGGGLVTNSNQSAEYLRSFNRNATMDLDAVYYNPAAVSSFGSGLHLYISNQTILQTRTIDSEFTKFNTNPFEGSTFAPLFPNVYVAYVMGNLGISGGLLPIGGGGSAVFEDGLPSFERQIANTGTGSFNGYELDIHFEGSSVYLGFQGGVSYYLSDLASLYMGARYITASNNYTGHLKDVMFIAADGSKIPAASVNEGFGDMSVDADQTGSTMVFVLASNSKIGDALNVSLRYETMGEMIITNETTIDETGLFQHGVETGADIPAQFSVGLGLQLSDALYVTGTYDMWFDSAVDWGTVGKKDRELYVNGSWEAGGAVEYRLSPSLLLSAGFLMADPGVDDEYNSDLSYSSPTTSVAFGGVINLSDRNSLSVGLFNTFYEQAQNIYLGNNYGQGETYDKTAVGFGVGYSLSF